MLPTLSLIILTLINPIWSIDPTITRPITCTKVTMNTTARVEQLLASMTLEEKVGQMTQINTGSMINKETKKLDPKLIHYYVNERKVGSFLNTIYEKLDIPPPNKELWVETINSIQIGYKDTRLKIPMLYGIDSVHGANYIHGATLLPQQLGIAASFNRTVARLSAEITAKDTRAIGVHWNFSPILDIAVNKQWPRVYETFGEDPYLVTEMGKEMILGYQGCHELHRNDKVAATMKHFIGYSATRSGKDVDGSWIGDRTLLDYFTPSFRGAVEVGVETAMESYSDIDGDHVVNSKRYLHDLLRKEMEFHGTLVTDWEQINKLMKPIHIAPTLKDAVRRVMKLDTLDMSMVPNNADFIDYLIDLVNSKEIPLSYIDKSVKRILTLKEKLGLLDHDGLIDPNNNPILQSIGSQKDVDVSIDAARESIVLLQNRDKTLPLKMDAKILITGPVADSLTYLTGGWTFAWQGPKNESFFEGRGTTILQGLKKHSKGTVTHMPSVDINGNSTGSIDAILAASVNHDAIVVCLGEHAYAEFKGDVNDMYLPKGQLNLMDTLIEKSGKPVILVLSEGRPRVVNPTVKQAHSVLASFLVGPYGGDAISEIIFGKINPSGKLPITYANHPNDNNLNYYRRRNEIYHDVYWEFGHGLSYTTFDYTNLTLSSPTLTPQSPSLTATITVTNTGPLPGSEVALLFLTDEYRSISPEVKKLRNFQKFHLQPKESTTLSFPVTLQDLAFHDSELRRVAEAGQFLLTIQRLNVTFNFTLPKGIESVPVPFPM